MAGDRYDQVLRTFCRGMDNSRPEASMVLQRSGTACTSHGCHHCTNPACPYAEFIRQYWSHPQFD